ncbi:hypothetical protein J2S58_002106 [Nakamurella flavida]|uniref:hypothetical protein n=1 Tax=Nakamurella flavida TaxID=363630 RepID=UPI00278654FC|nr:hypothetical protein [Nakamurella flavida]MDP9778483.1 hypothetical protein [Nakamurella flavida]
MTATIGANGNPVTVDRTGELLRRLFAHLSVHAGGRPALLPALRGLAEAVDLYGRGAAAGAAAVQVYRQILAVCQVDPSLPQP